MQTIRQSVKACASALLRVKLPGLSDARKAWDAHRRGIGHELAAIDATLRKTHRQDFLRRAHLSVKREILQSGLFDASYYLATYRDVRDADADPLDHYIAFGAAEGRKPNALFEPGYYCSANAAGTPAAPNPLVHYIRQGEREGLKPAPSFDPMVYLATHPAVATARVSPLWHCLQSCEAPVQSDGRLRRRHPVEVAKPPLRRWLRPQAGSAGVNFVAPVEIVSGLGTSARGYLAALQHAEVPVNVIPWRSGFEHQDRIKAKFPRTARQPINIVHLNADNAYLWLPKLDGLLTADRYNIAVWYWELSSFRPEWMASLARFDEIWCASTFTARSIGAVSARPVRVVRPAVPMQTPPGKMTRGDFGLDASRFIFFFVCDAGSNLDRKNPLALVRAYMDEFGPEDGATLLLKLNYTSHDATGAEALKDLADGRGDIVMIDRVLPGEQLADLWTLIDCYVSPHRSEGLGLTVIEAMHAAKPVIGTPYGGVADFLTPATAVPLAYDLVEIQETAEPYPAHFLWADPTIKSLKSAMRRVLEDPSAARLLGEAGRRFAGGMFSVRETAGCIKREIDRTWSDGAPDRQR